MGIALVESFPDDSADVIFTEDGWIESVGHYVAERNSEDEVQPVAKLDSRHVFVIVFNNAGEWGVG
jgi:hypothetical protein